MPLVDRGLLQGVLVVQTVEPRVFAEEVVGMLTAAGAQLASIVSEARTLRQFVEPSHQKLWTLARNLWWSWDETTSMFRALDPVLWRELDHNPIALLQEMSTRSKSARRSSSSTAASTTPTGGCRNT